MVDGLEKHTHHLGAARFEIQLTVALTHDPSDFTLTDYRMLAQPRFVTCLLVTGDEPAVLYVEGGVMETSTAIRQLQVWQDRLDAGEEVEDGDLAVDLLGGGTFAHAAIFVELSVLWFDAICRVGAAASVMSYKFVQ